jgi:CBS-domain-containing membrane protein
MRVEDVMTSDVVTARPGMSLKEAARAMAARGVSGLPVVDDEGCVIGVISEADLLGKERQEPESNGSVLGRLRHRSASEEERRFEARDVGAAMTESMWGDDNALAIGIDDGDVTLAGEVRRQLEAELLPRMIRTIPGVVGVRSDLTWAEKD